MTPDGPWAHREYQRMVSADVDPHGLLVLFEDGTWVRLDPNRLVPPSAVGVDWSRLLVTPYELHVSTAEGETIDIPWTAIRTLSDPAFGSHMADAAESEAREVGRRLRQLRQARGLNSKDLASRAGITQQSLSRIENGRHDVTLTTLQRLLAAMGANLADLAAEPQQSNASVLNRLKAIGIEDAILRILIPAFDDAKSNPSGDPDRLLNLVEEPLRRVFGLTRDALLGLAPLRLNEQALEGVRLKTYGRANEVRASAFLVYAHYIALNVLEAAGITRSEQIRSDGVELRNALATLCADIDLRCMLTYAWDVGIPVVPLRAPGMFHGACWQSADRKVIVLKQTTDSQGRWMFDLAHEFKHAASHVSDSQPARVEGRDIGAFAGSDDPEEREATEYAWALLLRGQADRIARVAADEADGSVERLKRVVPEVAAREGVRPDVLANYLAHRLSTQGVDWWGAATSLQVTTPKPWAIASELLRDRIDLRRLAPPDRDIVGRAIGEEE
jgi:transcriptional regulator with XRE-family HTH domain